MTLFFNLSVRGLLSQSLSKKSFVVNYFAPHFSRLGALILRLKRANPAQSCHPRHPGFVY